MTAEERALLALLDFPAVVRCDQHEAPGLQCRDAARFSLRCRSCDELAVFCPMHAQGMLAAVVVHCGLCRSMTGRAAALFDVEPIS